MGAPGSLYLEFLMCIKLMAALLQQQHASTTCPLSMQALRRELEKEREDRAAESARVEELAQQAVELAAERDGLQAATEELKSEVTALQGRAEALALSAETLLQDKGAALRQVLPLGAAGLSVARSAVLALQGGA